RCQSSSRLPGASGGCGAHSARRSPPSSAGRCLISRVDDILLASVKSGTNKESPGVPGTIIDMHLHTTKGASDSMLDPDDLIVEAARVGLTGVNITEHDRMWESWDLGPFRKKHPH